ncbi:hypothetical protein DSM104299_05762 [Baekduia alba]|uniref:LysR family transcriptional regulator n=1 Tax=Baekduia alba TaxID=2997333 RepID=UPI00234019DF|nr:LysR family transcriptional regulator [Baekduia alba]WCB96992.1 hypothetical protein DSM104299_05762 [Baekduia alba]
MLDVRRLRVLREVARQGSFPTAARELHCTQPAVSHQIARLEEEVGTPAADPQRALGAGRLRLATHLDNTVEDVDRAVEALAGVHAAA